MHTILNVTEYKHDLQKVEVHVPHDYNLLTANPELPTQDLRFCKWFLNNSASNQSLKVVELSSFFVFVRASFCGCFNKCLHLERSQLYE